MHMGAAMDIAERIFVVTAAATIFVLIGLGLIT